MPFMLPIPQREKAVRYIFFKDAFSREECEKILALQEGREAAPAEVSGSGLNPDVRRSKISWIHWDPSVTWLFEKLAAFVSNGNNEWWKFSISSFGEPLQLTEYSYLEKGKYDWHQDSGPGTFSIRKLSFVLLLNDVFEGGEFELFQAPVKELETGTLILFPSYEMHRVTEVTMGTRKTLVGWISGPPFA